MAYKRLFAFLVITISIFACRQIPGIEVVDRPKTEIIPVAPEVIATIPPEAALAATMAIQQVQDIPTATATPIPTNTPVPTPTRTPTPFFLQSVTLSQPPYAVNEFPHNTRGEFPRHGILIMILVFFFIMTPWGIGQIWYTRYAQPRSFDITEVGIKAKDSLQVIAVLSMTARKTFNYAALTTRWRQVNVFVAKALEQELIHDALQFQNIEQLELNLKNISDNFLKSDVIDEVWKDYGVQIVRFNIETRYPPPTLDALNKKAEASAGGQAFLAYAAAAHLNPDSPEGRELYRIYEETRGQVDSARNLGGGITSLVNIISDQQKKKRADADDEDDD